MSSKMKGLMEVGEELKSKLYDLERWESMTQDTTQSLELRLQRIEEMSEQTASQLAVIHRLGLQTDEIWHHLRWCRHFVYRVTHVVDENLPLT